MIARKSTKSLLWEESLGTPISSDLDEHQKYLYNAVLLSGLAGDLKTIETTLNLFELSLIDQIKLNAILTDAMYELNPKMRGYKDLEIRLYEVKTKTQNDFDEVLEKINRAACSQGNIIFTDPNYISGDPDPGGASGGPVGGPDPGGASGGPVGGPDPGGASGGPVGGPDPGGASGGPVGGPQNRLGREAKEHEVIGHWAFKDFPGINLENPTRREVNLTGQGVSVYVLDSVDHRLNIETIPMGVNDQISKAQIMRFDYPPTFEVTISSPSRRFQKNVSKRPVMLKSSKDYDIDQHGLFVAGLVHRVAPDCNLHLVDVLNRQGQGEVFGLVRALSLIVKQTLQAAENGVVPLRADPLNDTVFNLSLGLSFTAKEEKTLNKLMQQLQASVFQPGSKNNPLLIGILNDMLGFKHYVGSLRIILKLIFDLGGVIVAASGNDSANIRGEYLQQIPASYPEVIGVAASTHHGGKKANFSNLGNIMAPGGGKPLPDVRTQNGPSESAEEHRANSLTSVVPKVEGNTSGYAYWRGTSFATPLVSGLAALIIEKMREAGGEISPNLVQTLLLKYAYDGVIDVNATLADGPEYLPNK